MPSGNEGNQAGILRLTPRNQRVNEKLGWVPRGFWQIFYGF
jgi:hypothetical protein